MKLKLKEMPAKQKNVYIQVRPKLIICKIITNS